MNWFLGIDPGSSSGAICLLREDHGEAWFHDTNKGHRETAKFFRSFHREGIRPLLAVLERVSAFPRMGVVGAFNFGGSYGSLEMALAILNVRYVLVSPVTWQSIVVNKFKAVKHDAPMNPEELRILRSKKAKEKTNLKKSIYEFATSNYPGLGWRNFTRDSGRADALCMALYAQKIYSSI